MKYSLSFTAASLRIHDAFLVGEAMASESYKRVDEEIGNGKPATGKRIRIELLKRLKTLTLDQLSFLMEAGLDEARKMAFIAVCKAYPFIYEFAVEVLREKVFQLDYQITEGDYFSFFNRKTEMHSELEDLSESSKYKVRQVLFKILEEAQIIDNTKSKNIQPQFLSQEFQTLIQVDDPELLRVFFMTDKEISPK